MVDWEITATTIFCESVDDEVTLIVSGDGAVKCTGRQKYERPSKEVKKAINRESKTIRKVLKCHGEECTVVKQYRDRILGEK